MKPDLKGSNPRVLLIDVETAPNLVFTWGVHEQEVIEVVRPWFLFSFAYQWLDEKKIHVHALPDYPLYKKDPYDDRELLKTLWPLLDQCDYAIAHNGDRFDFRKIRTRLLIKRFAPPSPFGQMDTLTWLRRYFGFNSNRLDNVCQELQLGRKLPHTGKHLWLGCYNGDMKSWRIMKRYNGHDVGLLHKTYLEVRGWVNHPRFDYMTRKIAQECPTCQSPNIIRDGYSYVASGKRQLMECQDCGTHFKVGGILKRDSM